MKKLTNEIIDQRLSGRSIKRLEDYINCSTKITFACLVNTCNFVFKTKPGIVLSGSGCPNCGGNLRLSNEIIDQKLIDKNIKRLGDYVNGKFHIDFQCLLVRCGYIWKTQPVCVINQNTGCPKCAGLAKLTNETIDFKLVNRKIKRLSNITNSYSLMSFICLIENCNYMWEASPNSVLNKNTGCPKCANNLPLTNEIVDKKLFERSIRRLDDVCNGKNPIRFLCLIKNCNYIWKAAASFVINKKSNCPQCAGLAPLTNQIIDIKLIGRNIRRLEDCKGAHISIYFLCLLHECNYKWKVEPNAIINAKRGCPKCAHRLPLTNEMVDKRLVGRNIKRLDCISNASTIIRFQCLLNNCGHVWKTNSNCILNGETGCPNCCLGKNERLVRETLIQNNVKFNQQFSIKKLVLTETKQINTDFYLPDNNIIIEYNGAQHYKPVRFNNISLEQAKTNFVKQQARDLYLKDFCIKNNIKLIIIDGIKYKGSKLVKYITEVLLCDLVLPI